jgi:membrane protein DedA with SNARE-associated domain
VTLQYLVEHYGYLAVFVGTFLEGETILLIAGFAAHRGYLNLPLVMLIAFIGSFLGDQFYFYLGRQHGRRILARFPRFQPQAEKVHRLLERYHAPVIVALRFLYGIRTVGPMVIGMSQVPSGRFFFFNMIGGLIWAPLIAGGGYLFGHALELVLQDVQRYEEAALWGLLLLGGVLWLIHWLRERRKRRA